MPVHDLVLLQIAGRYLPTVMCSEFFLHQFTEDWPYKVLGKITKDQYSCIKNLIPHNFGTLWCDRCLPF